MNKLYSLQMSLTGDGKSGDVNSPTVHMLRHPTGDDVLAHATTWLEAEGIEGGELDHAINQLRQAIELEQDDSSEELEGLYVDTEAGYNFTGGTFTVIELDIVE